MIRRSPALLAAALLATAAPTTGCSYAVNHPAITAGAVGATLGFATCKLAKDDYGVCGLVGLGAGAFLGLVAATALWLGGDGHSVAVEEQAQPLPEDGKPVRRHRKPAVDPDVPPPASPVPLTPPAAPPPAAPPSTAPPSTAPPPAAPPPSSP